MSADEFIGKLYKLHESLTEVYVALDNDLLMLTAIGIRTCFDIAAETLGVDPDLTFKDKLEALVNNKYIGEDERSRLKTLVDAGSATAHRGWWPEPDDLNTMMEVLEHFIHEAFVAPAKKERLDAKSEKIKQKIPQRKSKTKDGTPGEA